MDYTFDPPAMPSLSRYRAMQRRTPGASILRALEYEALEQLDLTGRVLDFGGGRGATYYPLLPTGLEIDSVNIDAEFEPTHVVAPGTQMSFADASYDGALCLNVLEHVYDAQFVLDELIRVLKPGAPLYIAVPFLYRVHGHPDDYSRHTSSWWRETLDLTGFSTARITPLTWGRATAAQLIGGAGLLKPLNRWWAPRADILFAKLAFRGQDRIEGRRADLINATTPGWFIEARK